MTSTDTQTAASAESVLQKVLACRTLPSLPAVAAKLLDAVENPEVDMASLAATISTDPALAAKILRAANSSFCGVSHKVANLDRALVLLGVNHVKALVVGFSLVMSLRRKESAGFDHMKYWRRSIIAGTAARALAQAKQIPNSEDRFLAALLMDIGMLALDGALGEEYGRVIASLSHGEVCAAELKALGTTHAEIGGELCRRWKLPETLSTPVALHHQSESVQDPGVRQMTQIVGMSGMIADAFMSQNSLELITTVRHVCEHRHGISKATCDVLLDGIGAAAKQASVLFEMSLDPSLSYEGLLKRASEALARMKPLLDAAQAGGESAPLNPSGAVEPLREGRRSVRFTRAGVMSIFACDGQSIGQCMQIQCCDISALGIGFIHAEGLDIGSQFIVALVKPGQKQMVLLYRVVRCQQIRVGQHRIGADLDRVLREEDLKSMGGGDLHQRLAQQMQQKASQHVVRVRRTA